MSEVEVIEKTASLDTRAATARLSKNEAERLIEDFKPFLLSRVSRYSHHYGHDRREELYSAAMIAFYESIMSYNIDKGHFFSFANRVVCERIIDQVRRIYRQESNTVPLEEEDENQQSVVSSVVDEISIHRYEESVRQEQLVDEIEQFKSELSTWGITMETLSKQCPKHKVLRSEFKAAISKITKNQDIILTIQQKRYLPIKAIAEITGLPQKKLDRARSFIIASVIIKTGDYVHLSDYVEDWR